MTKSLEKAFKEAQKLSNNLQDEIDRQLLEDVQIVREKIQKVGSLVV